MSNEVELFDSLPLDCIQNIMTKLSYKDAIGFRLTNSAINSTYLLACRRMEKPNLEIFIRFIDDVPQIFGREKNGKKKEAMKIHDKCFESDLSFAQIDLSIRFGYRRLSTDQLNYILSIFSSCKIGKLNVFTRILNRDLHNFLYTAKCEEMCISAKEVEDFGIKFPQTLTGLKIMRQINFFHFRDILSDNKNIIDLCLRITFASFQYFMSFFREWELNERNIRYWNVNLPSTAEFMENIFIGKYTREDYLSLVCYGQSFSNERGLFFTEKVYQIDVLTDESI